METLITSPSQSVTTGQGQKDQCAQVVGDAAKKATRSVLDELDGAGKLNSVSMQNVLAGGRRIGAVAREAARKEIEKIVSGEVGCLRRIWGEKDAVIGATKGTETIASASDLFGKNIDSNFKNWGCDGKEEPTGELATEGYEMVKDGDYRAIFGGFGLNLDQLVVTTCQARQFIADHAFKYLREDGWAVFLFLFKVKAKNKNEKDKFFVARVLVYSDGIRRVNVHDFSHIRVWEAEFRYRVIVPGLTLGS